jgi:hypothetical protein
MMTAVPTLAASSHRWQAEDHVSWLLERGSIASALSHAQQQAARGAVGRRQLLEVTHRYIGELVLAAADFEGAASQCAALLGSDAGELCAPTLNLEQLTQCVLPAELCCSLPRYQLVLPATRTLCFSHSCCAESHRSVGALGVGVCRLLAAAGPGAAPADIEPSAILRCIRDGVVGVHPV